VKDFGWDTAKRRFPEIRRLLQRTGAEGIRNLFGEDAWIKVLYNRFPDLFSPTTRYVLTDCRFPNEAKFIKDNGGTICWIERPGIVSDGHASESTAMRDVVDVIIVNDSNISALTNKVTQLLTGR
jgi:hypothetical protein